MKNNAIYLYFFALYLFKLFPLWEGEISFSPRILYCIDISNNYSQHHISLPHPSNANILHGSKQISNPFYCDLLLFSGNPPTIYRFIIPIRIIRSILNGSLYPLLLAHF